jgi:hypothetical protein
MSIDNLYLQILNSSNFRFCWGLGGVAGAIIGGACEFSVAYLLVLIDLSVVLAVERPATKWPGVFENMPLFVTYPYLLPCAVAALVTFIGRMKSLILRTL